MKLLSRLTLAAALGAALLSGPATASAAAPAHGAIWEEHFYYFGTTLVFHQIYYCDGHYREFGDPSAVHDSFDGPIYACP